MAVLIRLEYQLPPERYRSGHNGADSKSDGRVIPARGFESHPLRHLIFKSLLRLESLEYFLLPAYCQIPGTVGDESRLISRDLSRHLQRKLQHEHRELRRLRR